MARKMIQKIIDDTEPKKGNLRNEEKLIKSLCQNKKPNDSQAVSGQNG